MLAVTILSKRVFRKMLEQTFPINKTLAIVCDAIGKAEENLREHIRVFYQNAGEEFITNLFYGQINYFLREASNKCQIEKAFLKDLESALTYNHPSDYTLTTNLKNKAAGLVADIVLHNKRTEGKTGGDFGLIIIHPSIHVDSKCLKINKGQCSGLLCQAKLKYKTGKWNSLKGNQKTLLHQNKDYSSLALYSYTDVERAKLAPISWTLFKGMDISKIEELLKEDAFDETNTHDTKTILKMLGRKEIGTNDRNKIDKIISPSVRQHLELRIYWPDSKDDPDTVAIMSGQFKKVKQTIKNYVR